jgi:hypothetical protein
MALTKAHNRMIEGSGVTFADFGATGSGNETSAIQAALTYASSNSIPIVDYSGKTYTYSTTLTVGAIEMYGNFTLAATGTAYLSIAGTITEIGYVNATATAGDKSVTLSTTSGLSADDVIIIWNSTDNSFSSHRAAYYDGEFSRVLSISGSDANLETTLISSYSSATTNKVYKISGPKVVIDGPSFTGSGTYVVRVLYADGAILKPTLVQSSATDGSALAIDKSYNTLVDGGKYIMPFTASMGLGYGILIVNCQYVNVSNVDAFGGRHATATGGDSQDGAAPCRFINIQNSVLANDPASAIYCADFHGNTADSKYSNCTIYGAVGVGGQRICVEDCEVYGLPDSASAILGYQELVSGYLEFKNLKCYLAEGSTATSVVSNLSSSFVDDIDGAYRIEVSNVDAKINASVVAFVNAYESSGSPNSWVTSGLGVRGDISNLARIVSYTKAVSGLDASFISIGDSYFNLYPYALITTSGTTLPNCLFYYPTIKASSIPTSGIWERGTIVYNTNPAAAGTIGWVCTTRGTPGTWKTFGDITA